MSDSEWTRTDPRAVVGELEDPAFGTDERGCIVVWNRAAERLLGYRAAEVVGRRCAGVVGGLDVFGNVYCTNHCNPRQMADSGRGVRRFRMKVRHASGVYVGVRCFNIRLPGPERTRYTLLHVLDRDEPRSRDARDLDNLPELTRREFEVLRLLAGGIATREIAARLFISVSTARTHVQNILTKMGVHSRVEAVCRALGDRLI